MQLIFATLFGEAIFQAKNITDKSSPGKFHNGYSSAACF